MRVKADREGAEDFGKPLFLIYWQIVRTQWAVILSASVVCLAMGVAYAFLATKVYRSTILISAVDSGDASSQLSSLASQFGGLASLAGVRLGGSGSSKDDALAILTSPGFIIEFIKAKGLRQQLFSDRWDSVAGAWLEPEDEPSLNDAYDYFSENVLQVEQDPLTGIVGLHVYWVDPQAAADWANELVARLNERMRARAILEAESSIEYLNKQLESTSLAAIRQGIYGLIEDEIRRATLAEVRTDYAFTVLDAAIPSDSDRPERPRKLLILAVSAIVGFGFGLVIAYLRLSLRAFPSAES